jgi:hypothetical protein
MRPATTHALSLLAITVAAFGFAGSAWSEEVALPSGAATDTAAPAPTPVNPPARGITMNKVEAQFGAPANATPPSATRPSPAGTIPASACSLNTAT